MLGGEGKAQSRRAGRHGRRPDGDDQKAVLVQQPCGGQRRLAVADDQRHDRALRLWQIDAPGECLALRNGSAA